MWTDLPMTDSEGEVDSVKKTSSWSRSFGSNEWLIPSSPALRRACIVVQVFDHGVPFASHSIVLWRIPSLFSSGSVSGSSHTAHHTPKSPSGAWRFQRPFMNLTYGACHAQLAGAVSPRL